MVKQIPKRKKAHSHVSSHIQKDLQNAVTAFTFNTVYGSKTMTDMKKKNIYTIYFMETQATGRKWLWLISFWMMQSP
jgi:hypothetical protein